MVEMSETADILRLATPRSLVLLDEIGRGTATYDGLALAWAVTEHLHAGEGPRPRTVFATHYHELTQLAESLPRLANIHVTVDESGGTVVFLHGIADGAADRSYGIHVASLAGLPESVLARAREVLAELESERTVEHLEPPGRRRARAPKPPTNQLPLFGSEPHPVLEELRRLELEKLSPLEALNRIAEWKRTLGQG
jgi:DNA mismatch repair protein MutS